MAKKVMLGVSGGVDSAVSAYLLKQEGYQVTGAFMRNWDSLANADIRGNPTLEDHQCSQEMDYQDAVAVAKKLNIPLLRVDFIKEYWDEVFLVALKEYQLGKTPNPDVFCNKNIKFKYFFDFAKEHGFDLIAMGHYARKIYRNGQYYLLKAKDLNKDQSYFLSQISQTQLARTLFPLGEMEKPEVRKIANDLALEAVMNKKDSTGICFIGERDFRAFLQNYLPVHKGKIIDIDTGMEVGEHEGVVFYTIGQRKGLGIGGIAEYQGDHRFFVVKKDLATNTLYVANGENHPRLYSIGVEIDTLNWISAPPEVGKVYQAKFRYRQPDQIVKVKELTPDKLVLEFKQPIKAITPGQAAVLYHGDICLGGGIIVAGLTE
ncbi:MAG: tRNA 2-thiouridine(34) synthase MnmA [Bacilli bacterium]